MDICQPDITTQAWSPKDVTRIIASGSNNFIGLVNSDTVLKYPNLPPNLPSGMDDKLKTMYTTIRKEQVEGLEIEEQILQTLGQHPRFVTFKGKHSDGILLQYLQNGSVSSYLERNGALLSTQERLRWAMQAAEAVTACTQEVSYIFCDFQGQILNSDGSILLKGSSSEDVKSSMPRSNPEEATRQTDIFALGSAIYYIMEGHQPFPELDPLNDEQEVIDKFKLHQFPAVNDKLGERAIHKCWAGGYETAQEVQNDLGAIGFSSIGRITRILAAGWQAMLGPVTSGSQSVAMGGVLVGVIAGTGLMWMWLAIVGFGGKEE